MCGVTRDCGVRVILIIFIKLQGSFLGTRRTIELVQMMEFQIENPDRQAVSCIRVLTAQELFQDALGELYSERYFKHHQSALGSLLFIFQIRLPQRTSSLLKDNVQLDLFLRSVPQPTAALLAQIAGAEDQQDKAAAYEKALNAFVAVNKDWHQLPFFQGEREGFGKFTMRKRSGGRYKQATCCKMGAIFQRWQHRNITILLRGVAYHNESGEMREFLPFGHGFHFQFGKPSTGLELGLVIMANHRQLSLEALSVREFVCFLFTLRSACRESCYTSLNRFNSFAPVRYASRAQFFVDGDDYFAALADSFETASKSILIMGWMLSPEFLLRRGEQKTTLRELLHAAAQRGVSIRVLLYHETCFLSNGSLHAKTKLEQHPGIKVLRHPCGQLPILWSHHGKAVIVDENLAFVGGLDICYGRFDSGSHSLFPKADLYPGLEHNNIRKNDQWDVKNPSEMSIPRHECRMPWHDVAQSLKGDAVADLVHHFYQLWNFARYENQLTPQDYSQDQSQDVKTVFSTKELPPKKEPGLFRTIENRLATIKIKGKGLLEKMKATMGEEPVLPARGRIRLSASQDYFGEYLKEVEHQVAHIQQKRQKRREKTGKGRNSGSRSQRYSIQDMKKIQEAIGQEDRTKEDRPHKKQDSFLLCDKKIDFLALEIDQDYISCLEKLQKGPQKEEKYESHPAEVSSEGEDGLPYQRAINQNKEGRDQCQVVRSVGRWSIGCQPCNTEFSIQIAYLQLISQAKHYVYIENQFFISSLAGPEHVHNEVAEALFLRIRRAIQLKERFAVYLVLPLLPGFSGDLEIEDCTLLRKEMQWQYDTICRGQNSLWQRLLDHTNEPGSYIQFLSLRQHGRQSPEAAPQTEMIYVHSKLMIVDDEIVLCGSANLNDRSLLGDRDSQIAVVTRGEDFIESKINGELVLVSQTALQLRLKLWKEHFGLSEEKLLDPLSRQTWDQIAAVAASNTQIYRQIFGCYPDDQVSTRRAIASNRQQARPDLYDQLSGQIIGHVVQFPLHFLQSQPLTCLVTEKQFYVPTECLT